jgi:hypothetical protein
MRSSFAVISPLVLLLGMGVADAADPTQLAETGGFLLAMLPAAASQRSVWRALER